MKLNVYGSRKHQRNLTRRKMLKKRVKKALQDLEQKQADKVAAIAEERRRQEKLAAEAAARAKREQERKVLAERKRAQEEGLAKAQAGVKAGKRAEAQALKQASADFLAAGMAANLAGLKNKRLTDIKRWESKLATAYITCQKQCRMWYMRVQMCEMRLEAREKRPVSEHFVDHVQMSLDRELATLNEARASLKALVDEGAKLNADMTETTTLLVTGPSRENVLGRREKLETAKLQKSSSTPSLPAIGNQPVSPQNDFASSLSRIFVNRHPSQDELLDRARDQVTRAAELTVECAQVLENCQNNCNKVMAVTNASLDQHLADIVGVQKRLESEKLEASGSIRDATHRIVMLKMKAQHLPQTPEDEDEIQALQAMLVELKEAKLLLDEDWRCKTTAFKIDSFCRQLTPIRAATFFKNPEADSPSAAQTMMLDNTDFPNANDSF